MKTFFVVKYFILFFVAIFCMPSNGIAIEVTDLANGYYLSNSFTIPFDTASIAFDKDRNLYTVNKYDFNTTDPSNTIDILKFHSATNYLSYELYCVYTGGGISGLEFDNSGNLYVAEFSRINSNLDIGRIDRIDLSLNVSTIKELQNFRPTGIAIDSDGFIYFPGRLESDPYVGDIYKLNPSSGVLAIVPGLEGKVGTAIAIDVADNIFFSTTSLQVDYQESRTIYIFNPLTQDMTEFAKTDPTVEELTFDFERKQLFVLEVTEFLYGDLNPPDMITISPKVTIDIKPGVYPNCININDHGVIPIVINGSEHFDVNEIVLGTLNFAGLDVRVKGNGLPQCGYDDWNEDGHLDLVCKFEDDSTLWEPDNGFATLTFESPVGNLFEIVDSICIRP